MARKYVHGMDELRSLVNYGNHSNEDAFSGFGLEETVRLLRACLALNLETLPDMLTRDERKYAAKHGKVSTECLRRLYRQEGCAESGPDWEGRS